VDEIQSHKPQLSVPAQSLGRRLALILIVGAVVTLIVALVGAWEVAQTPFLGLFIEPTNIISATGDGSWSGYSTGLAFPQRIVALDGVWLDSPTGLTTELSAYDVGDDVDLTIVDPDTGAEVEYTVELTSLPEDAFLSYFLLPYLLAWLYLAVGAWVLWTQRQGEVGPVFASFCAGTAIVIGLILDLYTTHWLWWAWVAAFPLTGSVLFAFALVFPQRVKALAGIRWPIYFVYIPGLALAAIGALTTADWAQPMSYFGPWIWGRIWTGVAAMVFAGMLLYHRFFPSSPIVRAQARTVLWGAILSFAPFVIWSLASRNIGLPFPPLLVLPWLILFPLAIAYSIPHYRTLDIGWVLRQVSVFGLLAVLLAGIFLFLQLLLVRVFGISLSLDNPLTLLFFAFVVVAGVGPSQRAMNWVVNRAFWGRRVSHDQALDEFSKASASASTQDDVLKALGSIVEGAVATEQGALYLLDAQSGQYEPQSFIGDEPKLQFGSDDPLARRMTQGGGSLYLAPGAPLFPGLDLVERQRLDDLGIALLLPVPGQGWMMVGSPLLGRYRTDDLQFLETLAQQTSSALDRANLVSDLERRVTELESLRLIAESIGYSVQLDDLLELIYTQTSRVLQTANFYVALYDPTARMLEFGFYVEEGERLYPDDIWHDTEGLSGIIVRSRQPIITDDYVEECRLRGVQPGGKPGKAWMGAPMVSGERVLGIINVSSFDPDVVYTQEQAQIFGAIAAQAAAIIDKARLYQEMQKRARQLEMLNEIGAAIMGSLDLDRVLNLIMDKAVELLQAEAGSLLLTEEETNSLRFEVTTGPSTADLKGLKLPIGTGVVGRVAKSGRPIIVDDVQMDERWDSSMDEGSGFRTRSIICVPLIARGQVVGVVELLNRRDGRAFDIDDRQLLTAFGVQAAAAIENARLFTLTDEALAARVDELSMMQRIDRELNATLDYQRVLDIALDWAVRTTGADVGLLATITETEEGIRGLRFLASHGYPEDIVAPYEEDLWPLNRGIIGRVALTGEPSLIEDVQSDPDYTVLVPDMVSQLTVPITREEQNIGVIALQSSQEDNLSSEALEFVTRLGDHAAIAIENARLFEAVQAANNAKTEFISFVSHELQQPMTAMKGYTDLLVRGTAGEVTEMQESFLNVISSNVDRMNTLVRDLLDVSRIEAGRLRLEVGPLAFGDVVEDALVMIRERMASKSQNLEVQVQDELPQVEGDRQRLVQVLTNLLSNAHKYTPEGGEIRLLAALENGADSRFVRCSVTDSGIGMSPEDQERLFTKYFRSQNPSVRSVQGTGLGLVITKSLVELQGGQIWVESELGEGSTFSFTVPILG
jgi:signal transduction histidine kinase